MNDPRIPEPIDMLVEDEAQDIAPYLEAYAGARLTPSDASVVAMRARIVEAARARAALHGAPADQLAGLPGRPANRPVEIPLARPSIERPAASFGRTRHHDPASAALPPLRILPEIAVEPRPAARSAGGFSLRRPIAAAFASIVVMGAMTGGAYAAASGPGQAFYGARLGIENALLPSSADARVDAEIVRLNDRLVEVSQASRQGDGSAVSAALEAYRSIADDALAAAGEDITREERLLVELQRHVIVLQALLGSVPEQAATTLQDVLDRSTLTIARITERANANNAGGNPNNNGNHVGTGGTNDNAGGTGANNGGANNGTVKPTPVATPTPKPTKTVKPDSIPSPRP